MAWAIVIPGQGWLAEDGGYRLTDACLRLLERAAALAERREPRVVVASGWSPTGGESEAAQMLAAWPGRHDVELVAEETAANTAQNMARSLPLLRERGVDAATVVCLPLHRMRVAYLFGGVYPRFGVRVDYASPRVPPTRQALAWEAVALTVARRQRRAALAELQAN